jgi:steroid 5-alpha reductase family enzyme
MLMCLLVTVWGGRLTYNFWIKGGFSGGEDYRWAVIRRWYPGWRWELFNPVFICTFQLAEILAFTAPGAAALQSPLPLGPLDLLAAAAFLLLLVGEAVADYQMFVFQEEKYRRKAVGEEPGSYARGFIESGLWGLSRHPNYFCEVSMWWAFYAFGVAATGSWLNWTVWGAVFLSMLFLVPQGSLDVTEMLSSSKYPAYAEYQRRVSRFVPWPPKRD